MDNAEENKDENVYDCIIAVDERGDGFLLKSRPSVYEFDTFDGNSLQDNINHKTENIPTEFGVYKCKIKTKHYKYMTDCGVEYDMESWLEDVVKLELNFH